MLQNNSYIAGVDEAGRGPLAGPVVVAAVILDPNQPIFGLNDSKVLTAQKREALFLLIQKHALAYSCVRVEVAEIDHINILQATLTGMTRAVEALSTTPTEILIDGNKVPLKLQDRARAIIDGDAIEPCISAASIIAKVTRDQIMRELDLEHSGYGFAKHMGYGTPEHLAALQKLGPCIAHRRSFAPVRKLIEPNLF
jgi:ribonuclease HII